MKKNVSNIIIRTGLNFLKNEGVDTIKLINKCDITQYEIDKAGGRISSHQHARFLQEASVFSSLWRGKPLSFESRQQIIPDSYKMFPELVGYCLNQPNARSLILNALKYRVIIGNCDSYTLAENDHEIELRYTSDVFTPYNHSALGNFMFIIELLRVYHIDLSFSGGFINEKSAGQENIQLGEYLNGGCLFGCNYNYLTFKKKNLSAPFEHYNPVLNNAQSLVVDSFAASLIAKDAFSSVISEILENLLENEVMDYEKGWMNYVCSVVGMSRWTLNERLKQEGTSFSLLVKEMRLKKSCKWLLESPMSIQAISERLCFSSNSVFSRFFSAHMGTTPLFFRKNKRLPL